LSFDSLKNFFSNLELWQKVVAGLLVLIIAAGVRFLIKWIFKRKKEQPPSLVTTEDESPVQIGTGNGAKQEISVDKSKHVTIGDKTIVIGKVEPGATVNINVFDYQDGVAQSIDERVRRFFSEARTFYSKGEYSKAIEKFILCLGLEKDREKLGAINLQIGNCYYELRHFIKAAEFYGVALREAHKANDKEGEASALGSIANTYMDRPASDGLARGNNVRQAVENYQQALKIFQKDEYPVQYATTQNNLGTAYIALPSATAEERAENVRKAIQCYQNALEIRRKEKYPQDYCQTSANLGLALMSIDRIKDGCYWLKEAYSLKQFLPDQGKRLESTIKELCKE
jgi:tetratricopeptide (TPR) repeat protein